MLKNLPYSWGFLAACLMAMGGVSVFLHPLNSDEGVILSGAWHLLQGRDLYEDSFEYVAPGSFYLIAGGWALTGSASYAAAKILAVLAAAGAALATVFTARLLAAGERISLLPAVVYFAALNSGPLINHNPLFILPASWSLYFAVRSLLRDAPRDRVLSGLLCGLAILFLQHKGAALALSLGVGFLLAPSQASRVVRRGLDFALAALFPLLTLLRWDSETLVASLVVFPMQHYLAVQQVDSSLWVALACILAWVFWRLSSALGTAILRLIGLVQGALLLTALQRPDLHHLIVILFPLVAVFPRFLRTWTFLPPAGTMSGCLSNLVGLGLSGLLVGFAFSFFSLFVVHAAKSSDFRLELMGAVARHCADQPYLFAGPFIPGLYFETGKLNATRYSLLLENFNTDPQFSQALGELMAVRPGCAVLLEGMARQFGHTGNNPLENFLARDYRPVAKIGSASILMPNFPPSECGFQGMGRGLPRVENGREDREVGNGHPPWRQCPHGPWGGNNRKAAGSLSRPRAALHRGGGPQPGGPAPGGRAGHPPFR